jgi:hypothetical protein
MAGPKLHVDAIRALQTAVSAIATRHFETEADGSHRVDLVLLQASKALG